MRRITVAAIAAATTGLALTSTVVPTASATVRSSVSLVSPGSLASYTVGCRYEARVKVDDAATMVALVENAAGSNVTTTVAKTIPAAATAIFVWVPTRPGRRTLRAVQATNGKRVYSRPITVNVGNGIVAGPFCYSMS